MNTGNKITYILLERGVEDELLRVEINKVFAELGYESIRTMIYEYPKLYELKQGLDSEREEL